MATSSGRSPVTTTPEPIVKAAVSQAVDEIRRAFPDRRLHTVADGQGGLWVELRGVTLGPPYVQADTFLIFLLPFTLPGSDIYPMFMRPDLARIDRRPLGDGFQVTQLSWPGDDGARAVVQ